MKLEKSLKKLLIFAVAAFMVLSAVSVVSAEFFDFEADDGGWVPTADWDPVGDWEWTDSYDVNNFVYDGSTSATPPPNAYSGDGLWGTIVHACHSNSDGDSWLSQTFDFSSVDPADATLSFYSWPDGFSTYDYCYVNVNGNEEYYTEDYGPTAWEYVEVDLSAYAGMSSVEIEFGFHASSVVNYAGWYIDDVNVAGSGGGGGGESGNDCSDPITVEVPGDILFEDLDQTTCGKGNDYYDTDLDWYDGGEDIIYELDVTADTTIIVDVTADTYYVGAGLFDDCPDVGTMVASDTGGDLNFNYDLLAAESPYYLMIDTWPSPDCTDFDLTISEPQNDVGVSDIIHPADADGTDPVPVEVEVTNYGSEDETAVPVHVIIEHQEGGGTMLDEGFEDTFPPTGWSIVTYGGTSYEWEQWAYSDTSYTYEPPGTGDYYAVAQDYETPSGTDVDTGLFTPSIDMTGLTDVYLDFEQCFQDYAGNGEAEVRSYSGGSLEEVLLFQTNDGPYSGEHTTLNFDPSTYSDPSDVQIEFWYTDDYYDTGAWGFAIDDVVISAPATIVTDYNETVNIDILAGETLTVDTFPDWTGMTSDIYDVTACTELATDADTSNDCMEKLGVKIGLIDTGVTSINSPQALMGPVPFDPEATVENFGDFGLTSVPVHAWIEGGEELKFSETFENAAGFSVSTREIAAESDFDTHTGEGVIKLVGETKGFQDFSDWQVLDLDGDGVTWHQTDYNACEGTYSAYSGVEGDGYNSDSFDWLISPQIDVGSGGRIEFDVDYDMESGWDYLLVGNSADGNSFSVQSYTGNSGGCITVSQDLDPAYIAPDGTTYICFILDSDFIINYDGAFVDNVKVYGGGVVYDETVNVDLGFEESANVTFPTFTPPDAADYTLNVCTEYPVDENTANDCQDLAFTTNAPVYIKETGLGYATIQEGIDAAELGQTVVVTDGTFTEDLTITKPITVSGELGEDSIFDENTCSWDLDHETFLEGTVYIEGTAEEPPEPEPTDCDWEIWLYDTFGDGWNGGSLDVIVDGTVVLDDITLSSGSGPAVFTFTVEEGSAIDVVYTPGSWAYENYFNIYDSEGLAVVTDWYPDSDGDWSGTGYCPSGRGGAGQTIFENFDVNPPGTFTDHEAAVTVTGSEVIVRQNTIHNVRGLVENDMFTIKGIHIYNGDSSANSTGIVIQNNTIRDILNDNMTADSGGSTDFLLNEDFESGVGGWTTTDTGDDGTWFLDDDTDPYGLDLGGATGYYMHLDDSYNAGYPTSLDEQLISPVIDCTDWEDITLDFHGDFEAFVGDQDFFVDVYDGSTWVEVLYQDDDLDPDGSGTGFDVDPRLPLDISAYADNNPDFQVRFVYSDAEDDDPSDSAYGALIDNVVVVGTYTGGPSETYTYGGASGIMVQGFLDEVTVEGNRIEDIHSAGWCYGVEYTPTNIPSLAGRLDWIKYHDDYTENGLGLTNPGIITMAIELTDVELAGFRGDDITEIEAAIGSDEYGAYPGISYNVWIETSKPTNPTTVSFVASGTSTSDVWNTIDVDDTTIPASGSVFVGINFDQPASTYPCGIDESTTSPTRGGLLWYDGGSWTDLGAVGFPGVWGLSVGVGAGSGEGPSKQININCNYFREIGDGSMYDVFNDTSVAPYPGVMFTVDEAPIPGPANASVVNLKCNYFDPDCMEPVWAVINKDQAHQLDATMNYWGSPKGPGGGVQDPEEGTIAEGFGSHIVDYGPVLFDSWLGIHANIDRPMNDITVQAGEAVHFDAEGSYAYVFDGCEECCNPEQEPLQYLWDFGDGLKSTVPATTHVFTSPGVYEVSLMVDCFGFSYHNNFMYDWDYVEVTVTDPGEPLNANADGENLGGYEATVEQPVTLYGAATGGKAPYTYSWDFGDGTSTQTTSPKADTIQHSYLETGTYTVTLTVMDSNGDLSTDTSTVLVNDIDELVVNIGGSSHVAEGDAASFTSTVSGGRSPYSYQWNFGDDVVSNLANPTHVYENSGTYTVTLTVTDATGSQETKSQTINVGQTDTSEVEINNVKAGLLLSATIDSDEEVSWNIDIDGIVLFGGHAEGTAVGSTQVRLPFSLGFGKVDISITAGSAQEQYTATMIGPFLFNLQEA